MIYEKITKKNFLIQVLSDGKLGANTCKVNAKADSVSVVYVVIF